MKMILIHILTVESQLKMKPQFLINAAACFIWQKNLFLLGNMLKWQEKVKPASLMFYFICFCKNQAVYEGNSICRTCIAIW